MALPGSSLMSTPAVTRTVFAVLVSLTPLIGTPLLAQTLWVATSGDDSTGTGTVASPWATITHALDSASDGSLILVKPGTYIGQVKLRGTFSQGVTIRSEVPYQARLRRNGTVVICFYGQGIALEGFDIAHDGPGAGALVIQVQDLLDPGRVERITIRNNVIHDSYNNDLLKVNNGAGNILVEGNMFYNQEGSDEHIDVNSVTDITIRDNIFFNDFAGSGRANGNDTSAYIVIKDSNDGSDGIVGTSNIRVRRNIFLNWEGSTGSNFVLTGEDGKPYHEAYDVMVENNLMLGNSANTMRSSFGVKGCRDITFRNNTVVGDLPALAFAMRLNTEGSNPNLQNIDFYNNVWSDPTGTMGATAGSNNDDFSDTPPGQTDSFTLDTNLYYNGVDLIPLDGSELINYTDDNNATISDPQLLAQSGLVLPHWNSGSGSFADGSTWIAQAFVRLVDLYGRPAADSPMMGAGDPSQSPIDDILGNLRDNSPDLGAVEASGIFSDGFEFSNTGAWSATTP